MKVKRIFKNSIIFSLVLATVLVLGATFVGAEPVTDETYAVESHVEEITESSTEVTEEAAEVTESSSGETETTDSSETTTAAQTEPSPTYPEPLPEISTEEIEIPSVIGEVKEKNEASLFWGFVAWICVGVGSAVILAVLLTTKTKAYRSGGKKRYSTGDKISGKQRLLGDKYYNHTKRK